MRRFTAVPNDEGHFDFIGGTMVKQFSYRYRSLFGVEGSYNTDSHQFTLRVVIVGLTVGVTGGVSIGADG